MSVNYSDLVNVNGTIYNKNTGKGYSSEAALASDMGLSSLPANWHTNIATSNNVPNPNAGYVAPTPSSPSSYSNNSSASPMVQYGDLVDRGGTIYNTKTGKGYSDPTQLAQAMGIDAKNLDWSKIKKEQLPSSTPASSSTPAATGNQNSEQLPKVASGQLYRESGSNDVYYIDQNGNKLHVTDPNTFNSEFGNSAWSNIKVVPTGTLGNIQSAGDLKTGYFASQQYKTGDTRVNSQTGKKEVYNADTKTWTPTEPFVVNNPNNGAISTETVAKGPSNLPLSTKDQIKEGSLVRTQGTPEVYVVENGKLRWVENEKAFTEAGYDWNKVQEVVPGLLDSFAKGATIDEVAGKFLSDVSAYKAFAKEAAEASGYNAAKSEVDKARADVIAALKSVQDWLANTPTESQEMKDNKSKVAEVDQQINTLTSAINKLIYTSENRPGATKAFVQNETTGIQNFYKLDLLELYGRRAIYQGNYDEAKLNYKDWLDRTLESKKIGLQALSTALDYKMSDFTEAQQQQATMLQWGLQQEAAKIEKAQNDASKKSDIYVATLSKYGNIPGLQEAFENPNISSIQLATLVAPYEAASYAADTEAKNWISVSGGLYNKYTGEFKRNPYDTSYKSIEETIAEEAEQKTKEENYVRSTAQAWKNSLLNPDMVTVDKKSYVNTASLDRTSKDQLKSSILGSQTFKQLTEADVDRIINEAVGSDFDNPISKNPNDFTGNMSYDDYYTKISSPEKTETGKSFWSWLPWVD